VISPVGGAADSASKSSGMRRVVLAAVVAGFLATLVPGVRAQVLAANPWLERRVLNIAHQGGEIEAPSNTLFAFKTAVQKGADVLELDVHATLDRELVVIHDATVNRTTDGEGRIDQMTLEEIKSLDAAFWFVPGCGTCHGRPAEDYKYRGFATGQRQMPASLASDFEPNDFRVPTLREVLTTFPEMLINIEIKATAPETRPYEEDLAALLQEFGRTTDTIVVSFLDHAVERFKLYAPEVSTATGTGETAAFWASSQGDLPGTPNPRYHALQVPIEFNGLQVVNEDFVGDAHANGFAVHVWTINDKATMKWLIAIGVDGIMTDRPTLLEKILKQTGAG
jgi:glycerophosphoryl diester phosphodiesterase